jgi:hypothetical protein
MSLLRNLFRRMNAGSSPRFDRYYGDVARAGVGYPTADEARRDMLALDRTHNRFGWVR